MKRWPVWVAVFVLPWLWATGAQAQSIPYSHDFEATDTAFHLWPTGDTLAWKTNQGGGVSGSRCLLSEYVTNSSGVHENDYYTSLRLPLVGGNTYRVAFKTRVQYAGRRKVLVAINTTAERSGSTLLHDFDTLTATEGYQAYSHDFGVETTGSYHLIYYGESVSAPKNCYWYTDDLTVTLLNTPPTSCTISAPANNSYYNPGQSVALAALPTDAQNNLSKVEWYSGGTQVAEDATPDAFGYYTASFVPQNGGTQTLTAKAIDSYGAALTSNSRNITVRYMPQVALTNLADHSDYYPGSQPVSATATDPDGTVQRVVFYVNGDSVGVDSSAPYQCTVPLVYDENQAEQTLTAKATDNDGLEGTQTFTLFVKPGPCSLTTPNGQLRQALCSGDSLMLVAEGGPDAQTLHWYHRPDAASSWEALAGADYFRLQAKAAGHYQAVWTYANAALCTTAVDTVDYWMPNTHFVFDSLHCHALLTDSLESDLQSVLLTPGATTDSTEFFYAEAPFQHAVAYTEAGMHSLVYKVKEVSTGCTVAYPLHLQWSDIKVQVPPVYVNHGLTSYGLAVGSQGRPWHQEGHEPYQYAWFKNGTAYATGNQMSAPDTLGPYFVVATDSVGCTASDTLTYVYRDMYSTRSIWVKDQGYDSVRIGWDSLTSVNHLLVVREGERVHWIPTQGKGYAVDDHFGGAALGSGHFAVFTGTGGKANLYGLVPNKTYYIAAYGWKIAGGDTLWDTTHVQQRFRAKEISVPRELEIPQITGHSVRLKWVRKPGLGVILAGRQDSLITGIPADSVVYADTLLFPQATSTLADGSRILYAGNSADSVVVGGLDSNATYHFKIWYYWTGNGENYYGKTGKGGIAKTNLLSPDSLMLEPDSGYAFTNGSLQGVNLQGADRVMLGNKVCKIVSVTDNLIKFRIPDGDGTCSVKVRKNNAWVSCAENFTYRTSVDFSQREGYLWNCTTPEEAPMELLSPSDPIEPPQTFFGGAFTPAGDMTILVLYIKDNDLGVPPPSDPETIWPDPDEIPETSEDNFYTELNQFEDDNTDFSLSNFYYQMTKNSPFGQHRLKFKVFPKVLDIRPGSNYQGLIDNYVAEHPDFIDDLDTRKNRPNYQKSNVNPDPDNLVDYTLTLYRTTHEHVGGSANVWIAPHFGPLTVSDGMNGGGFYNLPWRVTKATITHEISHNVYAAPHVFLNNSVVAQHYYTTGGWGTMNLNGGSGIGHTFLSNPWESWIMGWNEPEDITSDAQSGIYYISDFTHTVLPGSGSTTGADALKIRIPGTSQNLWITNHSGVNPLDGGQVAIKSKPGLYMMIDGMAINSRHRWGVGVSYGAAKLKSMHTNGNLEVRVKSLPAGPDYPYSRDLWRVTPELDYQYDNSYSFYNNTSWYRLKTPHQLNVDRISYSTHDNSAAGTLPNEMVLQPQYLDAVDYPNTLQDMAFGQSEEAEELGLNFNSSIFGHVLYNYDLSNQSIKIQDFEPIILNGLYIKIFPKESGLDPTQARKVEVKYDQNTLTISDKRIAGYFHLVPLDLPSEKDLIIGTTNTLRLDKLINPNRTNKGTNNLYPDFITPSRFVCTSGSVLELEEGATFIIENESGLVIRAGATVTLGENARIVVKAGCTLIIEPGALLNGETSATIEVEDNAYYCVATLSELAASQVTLGYRLGSVSPKLSPYLTPPTSCGNPLQNFRLAFQCSAGVQSVEILDYNETVDVVLGNTPIYSNVYAIPLSGLADGHYTVKPRTSLPGVNGTYASSFDLFGQATAVTWTSGDRSFSNILVLNNNLSVTGGTVTLEPNTQVYIKGTPVYGETMFSNSVTGGDIALTGSAKLNVRDGATLQGMCGNMWGGITLTSEAMLAAYNNMHVEDSYDGIAADGEIDLTEDDNGKSQFHIFNAHFANNLKGVESSNAIFSFNFIRNSTFTSSIGGMKAPFSQPTHGSCLRQISRNHVTFDRSWVKYGNFWNNTLEFAQNGLTTTNQSRGFNSVKNTYRKIYGSAITIGPSYRINFDGENITVPKNDIFCTPSFTLPIPYISLESPYAKYGVYAKDPASSFTLNNSVITGESDFDAGAKAVGLYANSTNAPRLTANTFSLLNHGAILEAAEDRSPVVNFILQNTFSGNTRALYFSPGENDDMPLYLSGNTFSNNGLAIDYNAGNNTTRQLHITQNKFENNMSSIELDNGPISFELSCNEFKTSNPTPTGETRYGLKILEGAEIDHNTIGGNSTPSFPGSPNGNYWPLSDATWNNSDEPQPVSGFISIQNKTDNDITYWKYHNEFVGDISQTGAGDILYGQLGPTTYMWTPQTLINRCLLTSNCGAGGTDPEDLQACTTAIMQGGQCTGAGIGTLPDDIDWVRPCIGSTIDNLLWPLPVFSRPGNPGVDSITTAKKEEPNPVAVLGVCIPNPAYSKTRIPYSLPEKALGGLLWITEVATGRNVLSVSLTAPGQGYQEINVQLLKPGIYAYGLIPANGKAPQTRKFVVIR